MKSYLVATILAVTAGGGAVAGVPGEPGPAREAGYPPLVVPHRSSVGIVYADKQGMTLYTLNQRLGRSRSGQGLKYCVDSCARAWTPLRASQDAKAIGDWTVVEGAQGSQWAYKSNPVFTYNADRAPGATAGDGYDDIFSLIAYLPPVPTFTAPASVSARFDDGAYMLTDAQGHPLFSQAGCSGETCNARRPLLAAMAAMPVGRWTIARDGDRPRWLYRGKPVFVSQTQSVDALPAGATLLRPGREARDSE